MASSSKRPGKAAKKSIMTPVMTLEGHEPHVYTSLDGTRHESKFISSISYLPDGKQIISGSLDKTIRRWDMREGKEIEEAREVCEYGIREVGVSRNGQWVVTAGGKLKVREVETGIVRTFYDDLDIVRTIDISEDSTLLAGAFIKLGSQVAGGPRTDCTRVQIWSLDTGDLVAGPFEFSDGVPDPPALRFSENSKKLAVLSNGRWLQVWDVQTQKFDVTRSISTQRYFWPATVLWTTKDKSIVAAFNIRDDDTSIYEFDASTLETVGDSFKGHTHIITRLSLSFDCALLASASLDDTIKLWSFESRQLLVSFDVQHPVALILSPDSRQLAYTPFDEPNIYICNIPPNILASISKPERQRLADKLLNSDATRRRKPVILPVISPIPRPPRPPPTRNTLFPRLLRKLLPSSSRTDAVRPIRTDELRNPLDFPATAPIPRSNINPHEDSRPPPVPPTTQSWWPIRTGQTSPAIVDVPLAPGKLRHAAAGAPAPDDEMIREEDYSPPPSPNPNSQRPHTAGQINAEEHGSGRLCFCC